jgi:hypothetical protein
MGMNKFFEFFIKRLFWVWLPLYGLYKVTRDILDDLDAKNSSN